MASNCLFHCKNSTFFSPPPAAQTLNDDGTEKSVYLANLTAMTVGESISGAACTQATLLKNDCAFSCLLHCELCSASRRLTCRVCRPVDPTGAPADNNTDTRCYLHFTASEVYRGSMAVGAANIEDNYTVVLRRCEYVELPTVGGQYVFGMTGQCAWRQGDFLALDEFPEAFQGYLTGAENCPVVSNEGGGSVMLVVLLIVVVPISSIVLIIGFKKFGPRALVEKCWKPDEGAMKADAVAAPQPPKQP